MNKPRFISFYIIVSLVHIKIGFYVFFGGLRVKCVAKGSTKLRLIRAFRQLQKFIAPKVCHAFSEIRDWEIRD